MLRNLKEIDSQDEHNNLQSGAIITKKPESICLHIQQVNIMYWNKIKSTVPYNYSNQEAYQTFTRCFYGFTNPIKIYKRNCSQHQQKTYTQKMKTTWHLQATNVQVPQYNMHAQKEYKGGREDRLVGHS